MDKLFRQIKKKDLRKIKKIMIKVIFILVALFLLSVVIVNILKPINHKEINENYKKYISQSEYLSDSISSERIMCIENNEDALLWRLRMIGNAKESIVLATFDLRTDNSGLDVISALYNAAERGVSVKILIDGIYQPLYLRNNDTFNSLCAHENIDVRIYNPLNLNNIYNANYRMHDKYIMVDDNMYLLGGRNTTDIFLGPLHEGSNIDRELLVCHTGYGKGESFLQLEEYFTRIWNEDCVKKIHTTPNDSIMEQEICKFQKHYQKLLEKYGNFEQFTDWLDNTMEANHITLISNETTAHNKEPHVLYAIEQIAGGAKEVIIQTPYIICNKYMYSALEHIEKNAELKLFINAVEKGSNPWGCTDYLNQKNKILDTGVDIYEVMNEYAIHTKTVLIDNRISIVGSYNLDMRSTYIDTELMLVVDSEPLNQHIKETISQYKEKSLEVLSDKTTTKGSLYQKKEMTTSKKVFYGILRIIIRPFRYLL